MEAGVAASFGRDRLAAPFAAFEIFAAFVAFLLVLDEQLCRQAGGVVTPGGQVLFRMAGRELCVGACVVGSRGGAVEDGVREQAVFDRVRVLVELWSRADKRSLSDSSISAAALLVSSALHPGWGSRTAMASGVIAATFGHPAAVRESTT